MKTANVADIQEAKAAAARARANCIRLGHHAGPQGAHFGPALSIVEIVAALYGVVLDISPSRTYDPDRDRFILSKGHGSLALYTVLYEYGFIPLEVVEQCETGGSPLPGQPKRLNEYGIEFSSGTLGMGLSFGVGLALSARLQQRPRRMYVVMGDGETNEGSVWEAAMTAAHYELDRLTAIVDVNDMQSDGKTQDILSMDHAAKWSAFGWHVEIVQDGHDIDGLVSALTADSFGRPRVVLAQTVKGKGVSFMENNLDWHHGRLSDAQSEQAIVEISDGIL